MLCLKMWAIAQALLFTLLSFGCFAEGNEGQEIVLLNAQIAFTLPAGWNPQEIAPEAAEDGVLFMAQSAEGLMTLLLQQKPLGQNQGLEAWAAWCAQGENVSVGERMYVDGTEFFTSEEVFRDGTATFTYRLASAMHAGRWIHFILMDSSGEGADIATQVVQSFRDLSVDEPQAPSSLR